MLFVLHAIALAKVLDPLNKDAGRRNSMGAMKPMDKFASQDAQTTDELLQSLSRSVNLLVKLKVKDFQGDRKLNEMILLLHSLGCRPIEIAEALGKKSNDINPVISRARKGGGSTRKPVRKKR